MMQLFSCRNKAEWITCMWCCVPGMTKHQILEMPENTTKVWECWLLSISWTKRSIMIINHPYVFFIALEYAKTMVCAKINYFLTFSDNNWVFIGDDYHRMITVQLEWWSCNQIILFTLMYFTSIMVQENSVNQESQL